MDIRQLSRVIFAVICAIEMVLLLSPGVSIYAFLAIGIIFCFFGWYSKGGLTAEKYIFKVLKEILYDKRKYRNKNKTSHL